MTNPNIFFTSRSNRNFWKKKPFLLFLICCVLSTILFMNYFYNLPIQKYDDDYERLNNYINNFELKKFFNQTNEKWYNKKDVSMFDKNLLEEIRNNWIIDEFIKKRSNYSYLELSEPHVTEQSMGQAQKIKEILNNKKNGFFIECGAYDGETRSNTLSLERYLGWTGLLIEADPKNFGKMLKKKRRAYMSPTCLSPESHPMNVSFLMANNIGRIHNSIENNLENTYDRAYHGTHVGVQCFPIASYIEALKIKTVDYFSLDIEGYEINILKTIPFDLVDIKTLSVEFTHAEEDRQNMIDYMKLQGYYVHSLVTHPDNLANDFIFVKL